MKKETPKTIAEIRKKMVEIETRRAVEYKWLVEEVIAHIDDIIKKEKELMLSSYEMMSAVMSMKKR